MSSFIILIKLTDINTILCKEQWNMQWLLSYFFSTKIKIKYLFINNKKT